MIDIYWRNPNVVHLIFFTCGVVATVLLANCAHALAAWRRKPTPAATDAELDVNGEEAMCLARAKLLKDTDRLIAIGFNDIDTRHDISPAYLRTMKDLLIIREDIACDLVITIESRR